MQTRPILLVEDNPDDVSLTLRAFEKGNIANRVIVAEDGEEALDYLFARGKYADRDHSAMPAFVLLDLKLPKIDGIEVLKEMRQNEMTRTLPVIILTSSRADMDVMNGYKWGANSYIQKPVDFSQFIDAVKQLGLYWLVLNETPPIGN
ncbi:MAG: response regulator [Candidatus Zixiibacteriota bacterium]|jgi:DNA-binding response OmpR family regulator